jgi:hypothetical protein
MGGQHRGTDGAGSPQPAIHDEQRRDRAVVARGFGPRRVVGESEIAAEPDDGRHRAMMADRLPYLEPLGSVRGSAATNDAPQVNAQ